MASYNPIVPPWNPDKGNMFTLQVQLEIFGITNANEQESTLSFKAALKQWWNDTRLTWDPSKYNGIKKIWLPSDIQVNPRSWRSDVYFREDAGPSGLSDFQNTDVQCSY